jgi:hypothetical protein
MTFKAAAASSQQPTLHCPNCNHEIKLTESLAARLLEETRRYFQEQIAQKDAEVARKTDALRKDQEELVKARGRIEDQVKQRLAAERSQLTATEGKKAREAAAAELRAQETEATELREMLEQNNVKLAEAQQALKRA